MDLRGERPEDVQSIYELTKLAFESMPFSDGSEADRLNILRADEDLELSIIAVAEGKIVGHIAFSPVFLNQKFDHWFGLGSVSVWPELQKQSIGKTLIENGLSLLKDKNAKGCILIGNPDYCHRFGFIGDGRIRYRDYSQDIVQWLKFGKETPSALLTFSPGLE